MTRLLDSDTINELLPVHSSKVFATLLEVAHADFETIRLCNDTVNITSNGAVYERMWFELEDADQALIGVPTGTLRIDNTDLQVLQALESISPTSADFPAVAIARVFADSPDTIRQGPVIYVVRNYSWDESILTLSLSLNLPGDEPFPGYAFIPAYFPGLHRT